jgi:hypothetical protein
MAYRPRAIAPAVRAAAGVQPNLISGAAPFKAAGAKKFPIPS